MKLACGDRARRVLLGGFGMVALLVGDGGRGIRRTDRGLERSVELCKS